MVVGRLGIVVACSENTRRSKRMGMEFMTWRIMYMFSTVAAAAAVVAVGIVVRRKLLAQHSIVYTIHILLPCCFPYDDDMIRATTLLMPYYIWLKRNYYFHEWNVLVFVSSRVVQCSLCRSAYHRVIEIQAILHRAHVYKQMLTHTHTHIHDNFGLN